ncbi:MAG: DUF523 domain-containing protein [candidate division WOR-3 bacterium]
MLKEERKKIVISACLGFAFCRYDGGRDKFPFPGNLKRKITFLPVCPEKEMGLGIPRFPIRIVEKGKRRRLIQLKTGLDLTRKIKKWREDFLKKLKGISGFVLKSGSPSCAVSDAKIYSELKGKRVLRKGQGFFTEGVLKKFPKNLVIDEKRLQVIGWKKWLKSIGEGRW